MKQKNIILLNLMLAVLVASVFYFKSIPVYKSEASWHTIYEDLNSIKNDSTLVVKGEVIENLPSYAMSDAPLLVASDSKVKIEKTYINKINNKDDTIIVLQQGGKYKGAIYEPPSPVELLKKGKSYILFLKYEPDIKKYVIVGDFAGQFKINNGNAENIGIDKALNKPTDKNIVLKNNKLTYKAEELEQLLK